MIGFICKTKKMSQHDIHEIISQISQTLDCPECKSKVLPHNITITDIVNQDCMFDVCCHRCKTEMTLSAHIEKTAAEQVMHQKTNSSSVYNEYETPIGQKDVDAVKKELSNFCGSFIETFCR